MGKQKSKTYALFEGRTKVYIGEASDPAARGEQHRQDGKNFTRMETTSRLMSKDSARQREAEQLETYRDGHGGKNPKYNETDEG